MEVPQLLAHRLQVRSGHTPSLQRIGDAVDRLAGEFFELIRLRHVDVSFSPQRIESGDLGHGFHRLYLREALLSIDYSTGVTRNLGDDVAEA